MEEDIWDSIGEEGQAGKDKQEMDRCQTINR